MIPTFRHVPGRSPVDHFGPEIVAECRRVAGSRDYRNRHDAAQGGRRILRGVLRLWRPCAGYSGPPLSSIRIDIDVEADAPRDAGISPDG
jgi:hypothetical protein